MLKINYAQWNQTPQDLRQQALESEHPRTRERYLAFYKIASGKNANQVSKEIKRRPDTVMDSGPGQTGLNYTGGNPTVSTFII